MTTNWLGLALTPLLSSLRRKQKPHTGKAIDADVSFLAHLVRRHVRYEEYLDKQITAADIFYLEDVSLARQLVELG